MISLIIANSLYEPEVGGDLPQCRLSATTTARTLSAALANAKVDADEFGAAGLSAAAKALADEDATNRCRRRRLWQRRRLKRLERAWKRRHAAVEAARLARQRQLVGEEDTDMGEKWLAYCDSAMAGAALHMQKQLDTQPQPPTVQQGDAHPDVRLLAAATRGSVQLAMAAPSRLEHQADIHSPPVRLLHNPTADATRAALHAAGMAVAPGGTLVVYYSGRLIRDGFEARILAVRSKARQTDPAADHPKRSVDLNTEVLGGLADCLRARGVRGVTVVVVIDVEDTCPSGARCHTAGSILKCDNDPLMSCLCLCLRVCVCVCVCVCVSDPASGLHPPYRPRAPRVEGCAFVVTYANTIGTPLRACCPTFHCRPLTSIRFVEHPGVPAEPVNIRAAIQHHVQRRAYELTRSKWQAPLPDPADNTAAAEAPRQQPPSAGHHDEGPQDTSGAAPTVSAHIRRAVAGAQLATALDRAAANPEQVRAQAASEDAARALALSVAALETAPFTEALLHQLGQRTPLVAALMACCDEVSRRSHGLQQPWVSVSVGDSAGAEGSASADRALGPPDPHSKCFIDLVASAIAGGRDVVTASSAASPAGEPEGADAVANALREFMSTSSDDEHSTSGGAGNGRRSSSDGSTSSSSDSDNDSGAGSGMPIGRRSSSSGADTTQPPPHHPYPPARGRPFPAAQVVPPRSPPHLAGVAGPLRDVARVFGLLPGSNGAEHTVVGSHSAGDAGGVTDSGDGSGDGDSSNIGVSDTPHNVDALREALLEYSNADQGPATMPEPRKRRVLKARLHWAREAARATAQARDAASVQEAVALIDNSGTHEEQLAALARDMEAQREEQRARWQAFQRQKQQYKAYIKKWGVIHTMQRFKLGPTSVLQPQEAAMPSQRGTPARSRGRAKPPPRRHVQHRHVPQPGSVRTCLLVGEAGVGKSTIAAEFVRRYGSSAAFYPAGVFWLDATSPAALRACVLSVLGDQLGIPSSAYPAFGNQRASSYGDAVDPSGVGVETGVHGLPHGGPGNHAPILYFLAWLAAQHTPWLLVLDGADDPGVLSPYLPRAPSSHTAPGAVVAACDTASVSASDVQWWWRDAVGDVLITSRCVASSSWEQALGYKLDRNIAPGSQPVPTMGVPELRALANTRAPLRYGINDKEIAAAEKAARDEELGLTGNLGILSRMMREQRAQAGAGKGDGDLPTNTSSDPLPPTPPQAPPRSTATMCTVHRLSPVHGALLMWRAVVGRCVPTDHYHWRGVPTELRAECDRVSAIEQLQETDEHQHSALFQLAKAGGVGFGGLPCALEWAGRIMHTAGLRVEVFLKHYARYHQLAMTRRHKQATVDATHRPRHPVTLDALWLMAEDVLPAPAAALARMVAYAPASMCLPHVFAAVQPPASASAGDRMWWWRPWQHESAREFGVALALAARRSAKKGETDDSTSAASKGHATTGVENCQASSHVASRLRAEVARITTAVTCAGILQPTTLSGTTAAGEASVQYFLRELDAHPLVGTSTPSASTYPVPWAKPAGRLVQAVIASSAGVSPRQTKEAAPAAVALLCLLIAQGAATMHEHAAAYTLAWRGKACSCGEGADNDGGLVQHDGCGCCVCMGNSDSDSEDEDRGEWWEHGGLHLVSSARRSQRKYHSRTGQNAGAIPGASKLFDMADTPGVDDDGNDSVVSSGDEEGIGDSHLVGRWTGGGCGPCASACMPRTPAVDEPRIQAHLLALHLTSVIKHVPPHAVVRALAPSDHDEADGSVTPAAKVASVCGWLGHRLSLAGHSRTSVALCLWAVDVARAAGMLPHSTPVPPGANTGHPATVAGRAACGRALAARLLRHTASCLRNCGRMRAARSALEEGLGIVMACSGGSSGGTDASTMGSGRGAGSGVGAERGGSLCWRCVREASSTTLRLVRILQRPRHEAGCPMDRGDDDATLTLTTEDGSTVSVDANAHARLEVAVSLLERCVDIHGGSGASMGPDPEAGAHSAPGSGSVADTVSRSGQGCPGPNPMLARLLSTLAFLRLRLTHVDDALVAAVGAASAYGVSLDVGAGAAAPMDEGSGLARLSGRAKVHLAFTLSTCAAALTAACEGTAAVAAQDRAVSLLTEVGGGSDSPALGRALLELGGLLVRFNRHRDDDNPNVETTAPPRRGSTVGVVAADVTTGVERDDVLAGARDAAAAPVLSEAVAMLQRTHGGIDNETTIRALDAAGWLHQRRGNTDTARAMFEEAVAMRTRLKAAMATVWLWFTDRGVDSARRQVRRLAQAASSASVLGPLASPSQRSPPRGLTTPRRLLPLSSPPPGAGVVSPFAANSFSGIPLPDSPHSPTPTAAPVPTPNLTPLHASSRRLLVERAVSSSQLLQSPHSLPPHAMRDRWAATLQRANTRMHMRITEQVVLGEPPSEAGEPEGVDVRGGHAGATVPDDTHAKAAQL